jgi:hypothetical protein
MEKIVNKQIDDYLTLFKNEIKNKITTLNMSEKDKVNDLLTFVYDYDRLKILKDDLTKPKRNKTEISYVYRCIAKRVNGEQCTRRKSKNCEFCGTHVKSIQSCKSDVCESDKKGESEELPQQKMCVFAEDIQGIMYYIDQFQNVYNTADILEGKNDPKVIAKAVKKGNCYTIPEFGLL